MSISSTPRRSFASDNASGVHPRILDAITAANEGHVLAYGADPYTARASEALCSAFEADAEVLFCFGGTGANVIALGSVVRPHQSVLCADAAHIWNDECAAPERFIGGKLIPVASRFGKLDPAALSGHLVARRGVHHAQPRVLSITQPTEWGTLYTLEEIRALSTYAHEHGLVLHVDGARFANAAAALDTSLADLGPGCGIDVLSFGGTKNGLLGAEAVIFFDRALANEAAYARKQATQLASKMRFLAAQFLAYLQDDLWRELAGHANAMAARLAGALAAVDGVEFVCPVECNLLFPRLPRTVLARLHEQYEFHTWDEQHSIARWLTSFDTTAADIDDFARAVKAALATDPGPAAR